MPDSTPTSTIEVPDSPLLSLRMSLLTVREHLKELWKTLRNMVYSWESSAHSIPDYSFADDKVEGHFFTILRLLIPLVSFAGSMSFLYYLIGQLNPTAREKKAARKKALELLTALHISPLPQLTDYEVCIAVSLVDTSTLETSWSNIGGLEDVVTDLRDSVILPFRSAAFFLPHSRLFRAPKGVLFYGPPGCGKTLLARATARAANARFFNLQVSNLVNMWYGESQKLAEAVFSLAHKLQPSIIFIDELDSFLTTRSHHDNEATRMMKTQFMALWDGLLSEHDSRILVIGATNRPGDLDSAILRRLPYKVRIPLPDSKQRLKILEVHLRDEPLDASVTPAFLSAFADQAESLSGSDLFEICREAALHSLRQWLSQPYSDTVNNVDDIKKNPPPDLFITAADLEYAYEKFKLHQLTAASPLPLFKPIVDDPD